MFELILKFLFQIFILVCIALNDKKINFSNQWTCRIISNCLLSAKNDFIENFTDFSYERKKERVREKEKEKEKEKKKEKKRKKKKKRKRKKIRKR
jgi:hypothetical protein